MVLSQSSSPAGLDAMVQPWPRSRLYAFPPIALLPGVLERVRRDGVSLLLVAPYWPARVWFFGPNISPSRLSSGDSDQDGPSLSGERVDLSPPPRVMEIVGLASEGAQLIEAGLSTEVVETILHSRAPATRKLYVLK